MKSMLLAFMLTSPAMAMDITPSSNASGVNIMPKTITTSGDAIVGGQLNVIGSATIQGNAFSVGGSTFACLSGYCWMGETYAQRTRTGSMLEMVHAGKAGDNNAEWSLVQNGNPATALNLEVGFNLSMVLLDGTTQQTAAIATRAISSTSASAYSTATMFEGKGSPSGYAAVYMTGYSNNSASFFPPSIEYTSGGTLPSPNTLKVYGTENVLYGITAATATFSTGILGTTTNDSVAAGYVGESTITFKSSYTNCPGNGAYGDYGSLTLGAGDWDISLSAAYYNNNATATGFRFGIGTVAGDNNTNVTSADTMCIRNFLAASTPVAGEDSCSIPAWRASIASPTTYFMKALCSYTVGTPQVKIRMSARRIR